VSVSHLQTGAIDRIPPHNLEAEMALIGSVLVDREIMGTVGEIVRPPDFYAHVHETIFAALLDLFDRGEPLDKITVAEELRRRDALERVGGLPYISSLMDTVQTAASASYYARIVREKSILRSLIHAGTQITQLGYEAEEDVEAALDRSEQLVYTIGERQMAGDFKPISRLMKDAFDYIDQLFHMRGDRTGLTSGFHDVDALTTGFQPGNFIIVAARPGMGKTSFALNMAVAAARESQGGGIAFFSLEMSNNEVVQRLISSEAQISMHDMRRGNIKTHQWEEISRAMGALHDLPIYLDDTGGLTVTEVRSRCRRLKSTNGLAAVFIDYLQLLRPGVLSRNANRNEEISEICRTLKVTAKDLGIPIIALAQLNRAVETRNDKRPMLADLRDCLPGDALVLNADGGERIPVERIVRECLRFNVWSVDERMQLVRRPIVDAWTTGEKQIYRIKTCSGKTIRCTGGHRFLTIGGWMKLRDLVPGQPIAVPRTYAASSRRSEPLAKAWSKGDTQADENRVTLSLSKGGEKVQRCFDELSMTHRRGSDFQVSLGKAMGRSTPVEAAERLDVEEPRIFAHSPVLWEEIVAIEPAGMEPTYDITVADLHNFCVDDFITHNSGSLEQEADIVSFLYREGYYNKEAPEPDLTEFIIAKHRNGPTRTVRLRFKEEFTLFLPYADEAQYPPE
jgi:replicative DNA helicase